MKFMFSCILLQSAYRVISGYQCYQSALVKADYSELTGGWWNYLAVDITLTWSQMRGG